MSDSVAQEQKEEREKEGEEEEEEAEEKKEPEAGPVMNNDHMFVQNRSLLPPSLFCLIMRAWSIVLFTAHFTPRV